MGLFDKKKTDNRKSEMKQYITGAGGSIVTKSLLNKTSQLKWLFRQESPYGNGWVAFGDTDTQDYVNNPDNMSIVDFNTLANLEPTVLNVFHMPIGTDLEFRCDKSGKYFVDTKTGQEIREPVKHPAQIAFEKNLKFLNQETYPTEFFRSLFQTSTASEPFKIGDADFPSGRIVLADPLAYLGSEYETCLARKIPAGKYPIEISFLHSPIAGRRVAAARLIVNHNPVIRYEVAMPEGKTSDDYGKPGVFTFFGVDTGLACITDIQTSREYSAFFTKWQKAHPGQNKYDDYFADLFREYSKINPKAPNDPGDFLLWQLPETKNNLILFSSGMGDGIYSGYWGLDENGEAAELVIPFMNPAYFL